MLGNYFCCRVLTFFSKINFFEKIFQEHYQSIRVSNSLNTDQDRHTVGLDLGSNCFVKVIMTKSQLVRKELWYGHKMKVSFHIW